MSSPGHGATNCWMKLAALHSFNQPRTVRCRVTDLMSVHASCELIEDLLSNVLPQVVNLMSKRTSLRF
jgi:hypothetical protein